MDSEIQDIKRLAGILTEVYGWDHAAKIADTYINGNIKDAIAAVDGNIALFAEVVLVMASSHGESEAKQFLEMIARRG